MNKLTKIMIIVISALLFYCMHEPPSVFYFQGTGFTSKGIIPKDKDFAGFELMNCHKGFVPEQYADIDGKSIWFPLNSKEDFTYVEMKFQASNKYGLMFYLGKEAIYFYNMGIHIIYGGDMRFKNILLKWIVL